mmetsp:Transcript_59401/g.129113  ORF Transcript_59401/g.129113 Transcript_59401/m.129113 type:complete len:89 (+) Transcript_59401:333-599(+)
MPSTVVPVLSQEQPTTCPLPPLSLAPSTMVCLTNEASHDANDHQGDDTGTRSLDVTVNLDPVPLVDPRSCAKPNLWGPWRNVMQTIWR